MNNIIDLYARAAAVLYGIISFDDFFKILDNYYGEGSLSTDHIMLYFWTSENEDPIYYVQEELIVHASISPEEVAQALFEIQHPLGAKVPQNHRILPEKEFLLYANPLYYEETAGTKHMEDYLSSDLGLPQEEAREIVAEMVFICRTGTCPTFLMDALSRRGLSVGKTGNLDIISIGCEIEAETRRWGRLGATGREMVSNA